MDAFLSWHMFNIDGCVLRCNMRPLMFLLSIIFIIDIKHLIGLINHLLRQQPHLMVVQPVDGDPPGGGLNILVVASDTHHLTAFSLTQTYGILPDFLTVSLLWLRSLQGLPLPCCSLMLGGENLVRLAHHRLHQLFVYISISQDGLYSVQM